MLQEVGVSSDDVIYSLSKVNNTVYMVEKDACLMNQACMPHP